jgi:hypothetical protein
VSDVVPAWFLLELLNDGKLRERRKAEQQRLADR